MDKNLMIFKNEQFGTVRTINEDGEPWFVGKDVAKVLGYSNASKALADHVDDDDKLNNESLSSLGQRGGWIINESGLYSLVLSSKLPQAKQFKRWITHEVIPSIRKHGAYVTDVVLERLDENPEVIPEYIERLRKENAKARFLRERLDAATGELKRIQPKADYYDTYINAENALCFRYVAKELGVSEKKLIGYLLDKGFLYRDQHRDFRVFPKANPRTARFFLVRDYHAENGHHGQYTVLTVEGRNYLVQRTAAIRAFVPKTADVITPEILPCTVATAEITNNPC